MGHNFSFLILFFKQFSGSKISVKLISHFLEFHYLFKNMFIYNNNPNSTEAETDRRVSTIEAEKVAEVSSIRMEQYVMVNNYFFTRIFSFFDKN